VSDSVDGDGSRGGPPEHSERGGGEPAPASDAAGPDRAPAPTEAGAGASSSGVPFETTVPPTRRQSTDGLTGAPYPPANRLRFPDDDALSRWLRIADWGLGLAEQGALFAVLGVVVLTAAAAALSDRVLGIPLGRWWFDIVRGGTFAIAMLGAVFATYQRRHLAMDLVSRRLPPRSRLVLRIALALFTMFVVGLLRRAGLHLLDTLGEESSDHLVSTHMIVWLLPLGASLIILHTGLHMVIDIDYLARGKTPPERTRSGH
jgi:TRAP-type mannitol/chloroaromatic compound transport system permease small subunit